MSNFASVIVILSFLWALKKLTNARSRALTKAPYPPGPTPRLFIGNAFDFPTSFPALRYAEWGDTYKSDILHVEAFGQHVVVLNKREDAEELFDKRAKLYSDRPQIPIMKLMGWDYNIAILPYGDEWRSHRKVCQQNFNQKACKGYQPLQEREVLRFLRALHETPGEFDAHSKRLSISLTMSMMYGYEVQSITEPVVTIADEAIRLGSELLIPGRTLINIFPILRHIPAWFPGASSHKLAKIVKKLSDEMMAIPIEHVKKSLTEESTVSSLVTDFYVKKQKYGASEQEEQMIKNIAYSVYGGASDTTISATGSFLWAMAISPEVQKKAQAEIDGITGSKRLPAFEDRKLLPYTEAIYREVLRLRPPLPLGGPHTVMENDHYSGYLIPKGAMVLANIWAMTHDKQIYSDPYAFKPERFFDEHGNLNGDDRVLAYGFGRRVCVGKYVASSTLWLMIASVIACFDISKCKDENGKEIDIDDGFEDFGVINQKTKFDCSFRVRSPEVLKMLISSS